MKNDCSHACSKFSLGYCPFDDNYSKRSYVGKSYCEGIKKIMEEYHSYRMDTLQANYFYLQTLIDKFESDSQTVNITLYNCCNSFKINQGNHRLCIAKKTGVPVYGIVSYKSTCNIIKPGRIKRYVQKMFFNKSFIKIPPYSVDGSNNISLNQSDLYPTYSEIIEQLHSINKILPRYLEKAEKYRNAPLEHPHELTKVELEELEELEVLHFQLETFLYSLKYGETQKKLDLGEIDRKTHDAVIDHIYQEKPYSHI